MSMFVPPPFDRNAAAADAISCSHISTTRSGRPGSSRRSLLVLALIATLPLCSFAARSRRSGGSSSSGTQLSALACSKSSLSGATTDTCSVTLSSAAGSSGASVRLSSSDSALAVPASVTIADGATSASFTATSTAVSSAQSATLTATDGRSSETYTVQLAAAKATAVLSVGSSSVAFGSVAENTKATQALKLSSTGTGPVTVESVTIAGKGFSDSGLTLPLTLSAGQSATLDLQFDPTAAGAASGTVTISSNASSGSTVTIAMSGTGAAGTSAYQVELNWDSPASSTDPVAGYNIYRSDGSGAYQLLNTSVNQPANYTDTSAQSGATYSYKITSVDGAGVESSPSNVYTATVP